MDQMKKTIDVTAHNGRNEKISATMSVQYKSSGRPGTPERHKYILTILDADNLFFSDQPQAAFANGTAITAGTLLGKSLELTRGHVSRLSSYPILIIKDGDTTKRGRYRVDNLDLSGLPGFSFKTMSMPTTEEYFESVQEYFEMAKAGTLPQGFDQWELADRTGWTVAHEAAKHGHLPKNFDRWDLKTAWGWTIAHTAAQFGTLPEGFDKWNLATDTGWTVAHEAAKHGHLPDGFTQWSLATKHGWTVAQQAAKYGHLPKGFDIGTCLDSHTTKKGPCYGPK